LQDGCLQWAFPENHFTSLTGGYRSIVARGSQSNEQFASALIMVPERVNSTNLKW